MHVQISIKHILQFVKNCDNKLSYAASFGMKEIPDSYVNDYKSLLSTFSELSIRENAGQQIVKTNRKRFGIICGSSLFIDRRRMGKTCKET